MKIISDYLVILISIFASIATLIGFYKTYYKDLDDQGKYGVLFTGIIALWFLCYNLWLIYKNRRRIGYSEVFEELNYGFTKLHSIDRLQEEELSAKEIKDRLKNMCTHISNAFKEINGYHNGVCIKLISFGTEGRAKVITLCRDEKSSHTRPVGKGDSIKHWLSENSDFQFIYDNIEGESDNVGYFINNNLPLSYDYSNTRLNCHKNWPPPKIPFFNIILRLIFWPLKYRSTIVVPIIPLGIDGRTKEKLRGFLCIDAPKFYSFNEQYDVEILRGISDGLYNKIDKLQDKLKE